MPTPIKVVAEFDGYDLSEQLTAGDALQLIKEIDLGFADCDFTERAIKMLCKSLKAEYTDDEWNDFIKEIH